MRIAVVAVTGTGGKLAEKIGGQVFLKGRDFDRLKDFIAEIFTKFDAIIFICAVGIAVRTIAPLIESKLSDPAIIVADERGKNLISLLSGHVGGANELTLKISEKIGANPVITTATDVEEKFSADGFAAKFGLRPFPKDAIKIINSAILSGEEIFLTAGETKLNLIPQKLIAGIGCRRGISAEEISFAIKSACESVNLLPERISILASVDLKSDEPGLLEYSREKNIETRFFTPGELAEKIFEYKLEESEFVKNIIGVGNICEAAALCCVKSGKFVLTKKIFGKVTVALLFEK